MNLEFFLILLNIFQFGIILSKVKNKVVEYVGFAIAVAVAEFVFILAEFIIFDIGQVKVPCG